MNFNANKPEASGLKEVYRLENGDYEWTEARIWRRLEDGALFWLSDSGCSCNCFADDISAVDSLTPLTAGTLAELEAWIDGTSEYYFNLDERMAFKRAAALLLEGKDPA